MPNIQNSLGGKPVEQRNWGQEELNPALKEDQALKPFDSDISAADAMRFAGAIPEGEQCLCPMQLLLRKYVTFAKHGLLNMLCLQNMVRCGEY